MGINPEKGVSPRTSSMLSESDSSDSGRLRRSSMSCFPVRTTTHWSRRAILKAEL